MRIHPDREVESVTTIAVGDEELHAYARIRLESVDIRLSGDTPVTTRSELSATGAVENDSHSVNFQFNWFGEGTLMPFYTVLHDEIYDRIVRDLGYDEADVPSGRELIEEMIEDVEVMFAR